MADRAFEWPKVWRAVKAYTCFCGKVDSFHDIVLLDCIALGANTHMYALPKLA